jgi:glycosyltransferase 2 family protein
MRLFLRNLLIAAVGLAILGGMLYYLRGSFARHGFSWTLLASSVRHMRLSLVLLAVLAVFVCYAIRARRWIAFSRYLGRATFRHVYAATLMGFSTVFLLGRAGEPIRPFLIARKDKLSLPGTFGVYVLERVFDTASAVGLFGLSLLLMPAQVSKSAGHGDAMGGARAAGITLLLLLFAMVAFLVYFRLHGARVLARWLRSWHGVKGWRGRAAHAFAGFSDGLQAIRGPRDLLLGIFYSAAHWLLIVLAFLWVFQSFGGGLGSLGYADAMLVTAITMLGALVQLPAVGGGAQAATLLALTAIFGIEQEPAAAAAIVLWLVMFAACLLAGVPLLIQEGWSMRELWQMTKAEEGLAEGNGAGAEASAQAAKVRQ